MYPYFLRTFLLGSMALVASLCLGSVPATAQTTDAPSVTVGGGDALQVGGLVQSDAFLGRDADGFRARSARLRLGGQADDLSYVVQTDFTSPSVLLDAFVQIPLARQLRLRGGLFKTPYSAELLTPRPRIRFAERARIVGALAPARQAGLQLAGDLTGPGSESTVTATIGAFNGTRGLSPNDNDNLLYLGRLDGTVPAGPGTLTLGASAGYSIDDSVQLPSITSTFSGTRALFQADAEYETNRWLLAGEVHTASLDADSSPVAAPDRSPFGFYLTAGVNVDENQQVLVRLDQYDPDDPVASTPENQLLLGYNYDVTSLLRVLVNYQAATDDLGGGFFTGRLQVAL